MRANSNSFLWQTRLRDVPGSRVAQRQLFAYRFEILKLPKYQLLSPNVLKKAQCLAFYINPNEPSLALGRRFNSESTQRQEVFAKAVGLQKCQVFWRFATVNKNTE